MNLPVSIADFSRFPIHRKPGDGEKNGQVFREKRLLPKIQEADRNNGMVVISLEGVEGFSSAFLDEAFGGLVSENHYTPDRLRELLRLKIGDPAHNTFIEELWEAVDEAQKERDDS